MSMPDLPEIPAELDTDVTDANVLKVAADYVRMRTRETELTGIVDEFSKRLKAKEAFLVEKMREQGVTSLRIGGKTIYHLPDMIVSKGKGVETDQIIAVLRHLGPGFSELIGEGYNPTALKSRVKELVNAAVEAKLPGDSFVCVGPGSCGGIFANIADAMQESGACRCGGMLVKATDGVPNVLRRLLYVEPLTKMGMRSS